MMNMHSRNHSRINSITSIFILLVTCSAANAQHPATINYDESKVGTYTLPDPLLFLNGQKVASAGDWMLRRSEILKLYEENIYGRSPSPAAAITYNVVEEDRHALNGKAIRKQVDISLLGNEDGPTMHLLLYLPAKAAKPSPIFFGLSFAPVHELYADTNIIIHDEWVRPKKIKITPDKNTRGTAKGWKIDECLDRGYGVAMIYYCDIEPDFIGGARFGIKPYFFKAGQTEPEPDEWGAISEWAWGLSRGMDYIEKDKDIDARRVVLVGHSRLGKTVLWAGAQDARFSAVVANCSGEMGAALARRNFGETIDTIANKFPHWFCRNFQKYKEHWNDMPVDAHMLISLIAPRPVFVNTGTEDAWSDPKGQFLAAVAAGPVYRLLGKDDLGSDHMPAIDRPIFHTISFQYRTGIHAVLPEDWKQFLNFADTFVKN